MSDRRVFTIAEVAAQLGVSRATLYRQLREPDHPPIVQLSAQRVGIRAEDVDKWVASRVRSSEEIVR